MLGPPNTLTVRHHVHRRTLLRGSAKEVFLYMTSNYECGGRLKLQGMQVWGVALTEILSTFSLLSSSLSCPAHCAPSTVIPFACGLSCGILLGLCLGIWGSWIFLRTYLVHLPPASPQAPSDPGLRRRSISSRLQAYVHE